MSAEKFFVLTRAVVFVFRRLIWFLIGVSGSVSAWFSALSMLPKVTFNVAKAHFSTMSSVVSCALFCLGFVASWLYARRARILKASAQNLSNGPHSKNDEK